MLVCGFFFFLGLVLGVFLIGSPIVKEALDAPDLLLLFLLKTDLRFLSGEFFEEADSPTALPLLFLSADSGSSRGGTRGVSDPRVMKQL